MSYKGKKVVRVLGRIKGGVRITILQYSNRVVEIVDKIDRIG